MIDKDLHHYCVRQLHMIDKDLHPYCDRQARIIDKDLHHYCDRQSRIIDSVNSPSALRSKRLPALAIAPALTILDPGRRFSPFCRSKTQLPRRRLELSLRAPEEHREISLLLHRRISDHLESRARKQDMGSRFDDISTQATRGFRRQVRSKHAAP